jgi:hypothetical protein
VRIVVCKNEASFDITLSFSGEGANIPGRIAFS